MPGISQNRRAIGPPSFGSGYRAVVGAPAAAYWNPAVASPHITVSGGGRNATTNNSGVGWVNGVTGRSSGKYYAEVLLGDTNEAFGLSLASAGYTVDYLGSAAADTVGWWASDGGVLLGDVPTDYGPFMTAGAVLGIAADLTARRLYFSVGGVYRGGGNPVAGTGGFDIASLVGTLYLAGMPSSNSSPLILRTALADFTTSPPAGYSAWG